MTEIIIYALIAIGGITVLAATWCAWEVWWNGYHIREIESDRKVKNFIRRCLGKPVPHGA